MRRRRIVAVLAVVTVLLVAGAVMGVVPLPLAVVATGALGGYVYLLRAQSRARAQAAESRRHRDQSRTAPAEARRQRETWEPVEVAGAVVHAGTARHRSAARDRLADERPWTAERMLEQAAALRAGQDVEADLGLDEYAYPHEYETARAVNE